MNIFTKNIDESGANFGFIDRKKLLEYITEEDIFKLVFGFKPEEFQYTTSPFRPDTTAGCWFERNFDGKLKFKDFGSQIYIRGKKMINIDCFDAVQVYFKLPNLFTTLKFIQDKLILNKENIIPIKQVLKKKDKIQFDIHFSAREPLMQDKFFWEDRYGIVKENLIEDSVFCVDKYVTISNKGKFLITPKNITYCFTEFASGHKKIYQPFDSNKRFLTNCQPIDIGGLHLYKKNTKKLVITKSYKDWRVLVNLGINSIWFTSEVTPPPLEYLLSYCFNHEEIIIFFDNDETGIINANKLAATINSYFPGKAQSLILPVMLLKEDITDPSDLIYKKGLLELLKFLKESQLL